MDVFLLVWAILATALLLPLGVAYRNVRPLREQAYRELAELDKRYTDLLFAARPLAEKTTWSFTGFTPQVRAEEVARNARCEELRRVIRGQTGATLRPEDLSQEAKGIPDAVRWDKDQ